LGTQQKDRVLMKDAHKRLMYRINAAFSILFQLTVLWTIVQHSLSKERNLSLLLVTILSVIGAAIAAPFNWSDRDRRFLKIAHIVIQVLMIGFLIYALI
jgi:threonine/homoserine/homoserine lactone efflux protein